MRYEIKNKQVIESLLIDAPYDTKQDALEALNDGVNHNCSQCYDDMCIIGQGNNFKD